MSAQDYFIPLTNEELDQVSGAGDPFSDISYGLGAAAAVSAGLATVPTPASPALAGFAVITGVMAAGAGYISATYGGGNNYEKEK